MKSLKHLDKGVAVLLGVAAFGVNHLSYFIARDLSIPIGNIFLFWSAGALGIIGAAISSVVALLPEAILGNQIGDYIYAGRVAALSLALGFCAERYPKLPGFTLALALWLTVFAPLLVVCHRAGWLAKNWAGEFMLEYMLFAGVGEVLLIMLSGMLLLHPSIWGAVSQKPRHISLVSLLVHTVALTATAAMYAGLILPNNNWFQLDQYHNHLGVLFWLIVVGIVAPSLLAWRIAVVIREQYWELFGGSLLDESRKSESFSGLASEFWRRQLRTSEERRDAYLGRDNLAGQGPGGERYLAPYLGICAINRDLTLGFANHKFQKLLGLSSPEVVGKKISEIGLQASLTEFISRLVERTSKRGPHTAELKLNQLPDQLRFLEFQTLGPEVFAGEEPAFPPSPDSVVIAVKDITDRRTVESHLLQAQKVDSLGSLMTGVAHAFNNLLTAIAGQASYAKYVSGKDKIEPALNEILAATARAGTLSRQLLEYANQQPGKTRVEDARVLIKARLSLLNKLVGDGYQITFNNCDTPLWVECDGQLIMQALTNLLLNSRDSYPQQTVAIEISLDTEEIAEDIATLHIGARAGKFARIKVKDSGRGMSAELLSKAFDPLFTTKLASGHSGLGLSIVFAIVRAHDGFLTVESRPEKGTTVAVYLPLTDQHPGEEQAESPIPAAVNGNPSPLRGSEKILVVEDQRELGEIIEKMLRTLGYEVSYCDDGEGALRAAENTAYDLVLIDLSMPKIPGIEVVDKLRAKRRDLRILVMTGYGVTEAATQRDVPTISKPFDLATLGAAIRSLLDSQAQQATV